jgi:hypothetical protein
MRLAEKWEERDIPPPPPRIEIETLAGTWRKTNEKPQWIDSLTVTTEGNELFVEIFGSSAPSPPRWGRAKAEVLFSGGIDTGDARAGAFLARYRFEGMDVEVHANLNIGLLVVATFVKFRARGPLVDRFTREFFFRETA